MGVTPAKVLKGVVSNLTRRKAASRFPALSWLQVKLLKHQEDCSVKKLKIGNLHINYKRPYELLHTYKELFIDEIYCFQSGRPDPLVIDCGANIGMSVLYFKSIYPSAHIIAYEPDPGNFSLLQSNIQANKLHDVQPVQSAIWIENGSISFAATGSEASQITTAPGENTVEIPATRLADIIQNKKIDFLKLDIEGVELQVILDCAPYLDNIQNLFVEYHGKVSETEKLQQLLSILQNSFHVYLKLAADNLHHPFTDKSTNGMFDVQLNIFCYK